MNIQIWIPFSLAIFRAPYVAWFSVTPQVIISQGVLTGTTLETRLGRYFSKFSGLPYGQPPVGDLRFSSPIPAKGWDGVLSADKDNIMCPQFSGSEVVGQEDCLYLNVYAPLREFSSTIASKSKRSSLFPVIVFVPGGAYAFGSNSPSSFGPHYLLDKDIILVTINYRIGIFGFLTTGDLIAPGNYGLKDQVLALKWVQQNIESFGGDPKKITLMGSSSGAGAVSLHSLSHSSIGLFNQYIFQSGSALCPWNYRRKEDFKPDIRKMAKNVDCVTEDSKDLIKCLREINFEALLTATKSVKSALDELPWRPTDELESEEAFLTDSPLNLIAQNKMKDLPFICGTVSNEGIYYTKELYSNPSSTAIHTFYNNLPNKNECIKDYYFKESILTKNEATFLKNLTDFLGDSKITYPMKALIDKAANTTKSPFYVYNYGYHSDSNDFELRYGIKQECGVAHSTELLSLFDKEPMRPISERDGYMIDVMVDLWTSFAKNGKPKSNHLKDPHMWQPYTKNQLFLQFGNISNMRDPSVTIESNFFADRMNFWKTNFPMHL